MSLMLFIFLQHGLQFLELIFSHSLAVVWFYLFGLFLKSAPLLFASLRCFRLLGCLRCRLLDLCPLHSLSIQLSDLCLFWSSGWVLFALWLDVCFALGCCAIGLGLLLWAACFARDRLLRLVAFGRFLLSRFCNCFRSFRGFRALFFYISNRDRLLVWDKHSSCHEEGCAGVIKLKKSYLSLLVWLELHWRTSWVWPQKSRPYCGNEGKTAEWVAERDEICVLWT